MLTKIISLAIQEETKRVEWQIEEIEKSKGNSTRTFNAMKDVNKINPKKSLLIKHKNQYTANENIIFKKKKYLITIN